MFKKKLKGIIAAVALGIAVPTFADTITIDLGDLDRDKIEDAVNNLKDYITDSEMLSCDTILAETKELLEANGKELEVSDEDFLEKCESYSEKYDDFVSYLDDNEFEIPEEGVIEIEVPSCEEVVDMAKDKIDQLPEDKKPPQEYIDSLNTFCEDNAVIWEGKDWEDWKEQLIDEINDFNFPACEEILPEIETYLEENQITEIDMAEVEAVCLFLEPGEDDTVIGTINDNEIKVPSCDEVIDVIDIISERLPEDNVPTYEDKLEACSYFDDLAEEQFDIDTEVAGENTSANTNGEGSSGSDENTFANTNGEGSSGSDEESSGSFGYMVLMLFGAGALLRHRR